MFITDEDYLEHFGVKGMKWGVRKKPRTSTKTLRNNASALKNAFK